MRLYDMLARPVPLARLVPCARLMYRVLVWCRLVVWCRSLVWCGALVWCRLHVWCGVLVLCGLLACVSNITLCCACELREKSQHRRVFSLKFSRLRRAGRARYARRGNLTTLAVTIPLSPSSPSIVPITRNRESKPGGRAPAGAEGSD